MYLPLSKVFYFESQGHDIRAKTETDSFVFLGTINELTEKLADKGFVRISRSHIVNIDHIFKEFDNKVVLKKGDDLYS